jgi:nitrogen fixation protein FixH
MNWGKGIFISFILFAAFLAVMVTIMVRQDISLVSKTYYAEDLAFQQQYERKQNTGQLAFKPEISIEQQQFLKVYFPSGGAVEAGEVKLFRPSTDKLDQHVTLKASSDSVQVFTLKPLEVGPYRVKMTWKMGGKEYYIEKVIVI